MSRSIRVQLFVYWYSYSCQVCFNCEYYRKYRLWRFMRRNAQDVQNHTVDESSMSNLQTSQFLSRQRSTNRESSHRSLDHYLLQLRWRMWTINSSDICNTTAEEMRWYPQKNQSKYTWIVIFLPKDTSSRRDITPEVLSRSSFNATTLYSMWAPSIHDYYFVYKIMDTRWKMMSSLTLVGSYWEDDCRSRLKGLCNFIFCEKNKSDEADSE